MFPRFAFGGGRREGGDEQIRSRRLFTVRSPAKEFGGRQEAAQPSAYLIRENPLFPSGRCAKSGI